MIPVIGTAVVNTPYWVYRLIKSVDYPVDKFIIINNNGRGQIDEELNKIALIKNDFINEIKVCHMPGNIGCSGAWNLIIKSYIMSPFWLITNHDVEFPKGLLERMYEESKKDFGVIHAENNEDGFGKWDLFLIQDWVIQSCGLFDENLYPAYGEDFDYIMRLINMNIKCTTIGIDYKHGFSSYSESGSQTWRSDSSLKEKLHHCSNINSFEYMNKKWGKLWRNYKPFSNPFENKSLDQSYTTFDLSFVRRKYLGF